MILHRLDDETRTERRYVRRADNYQRILCACHRETGDSYLTFFAILPIRISNTKLVWLDWFEACPVGVCHGRYGNRNGFDSIRRRTSWHYRLKPESFWTWLWRATRTKVWRT